METEKVQTGSTQVDPCQVCQEGSTEAQTSSGFTSQDCIDYYIGKPRAFLHSNDSNQSKHCMKTFDEAFEIWRLWEKVLGKDKRSFKEYFSEEHGVEIGDDISLNNIIRLLENNYEPTRKNEQASRP